MAEVAKTTARKSTEAARRVRGFVKDMMTRVHQASADGTPVAYTMMGCMYEDILEAMGIVPLWTENYAGLCAAKRRAEDFLLRAEADGYANVICGYVRTGLGFEALRSELRGIPADAPDGGMPKPDLLLGSSSGCDPRFKWYQAAGRYLDVPTYCFDVLAPPVDADLSEVEPYQVAYQAQQFYGLIDFLERHTGRKMDYDSLDAAFENSQQVYQVWYDCDQLRKAVPAPMPSQDHFNVFVPGMCRPSASTTIDFYKGLHAELTDRVARGVGVIENERYRLLWGGGLPPWHSMWAFNYFEERGAVFVIEYAYRTWDPVEIPATIHHPVEKLAYRTFKRFTQKYAEANAHTGSPNAERLLGLIRDYRIDGMAMHVTKSCRAMSIGQLHVRNLIQKSIDVPFLQLQSDIIDLRDYSEDQWRSSIDAFLETVAARKV